MFHSFKKRKLFNFNSSLEHEKVAEVLKEIKAAKLKKILKKKAQSDRLSSKMDQSGSPDSGYKTPLNRRLKGLESRRASQCKPNPLPTDTFTTNISTQRFNDV